MEKKNYVAVMKDQYYEQNGGLDDFNTRAVLHLAETYFPDKTATIVDVGIGFGQCALPLHNAGYKKIIGVDIDNAESENLGKKGISVHVANLEKEKIPLEDDVADVVISFHVIEHIHNFDNYMKEIYRVLKKGGVFVCVTPDFRKQYKTFYFDPTHVKPYDTLSLPRLFSMYDFTVLSSGAFGAFPGIGLLKLYRLHPKLMFTGEQCICIGKK